MTDLEQEAGVDLGRDDAGPWSAAAIDRGPAPSATRVVPLRDPMRTEHGRRAAFLLLMGRGVTPWERAFLESIRDRQWITRRQATVLAKLDKRVD